MANFKLSDTTRNYMMSEANRLLSLPVVAAYGDFPLSEKECYEAMVPTDARRAIGVLDTLGADRSKREVFYGTVQDAGIKRAALIQIHFPQSMTYVWENQIYDFSAKQCFKRRLEVAGADRTIPFNMDVLSDKQRELFVEWCNAATYQRRLTEAARRLINEFVYTYCNSTAELLARWPGLRVLFAKMDGGWSERIRDIPRRNLYNWSWENHSAAAVEWSITNENKMNAVEGVLAGALLMDAGQSEAKRHPERHLHASILTWDGGPT
jgi:hypothetical protein